MKQQTRSRIATGLDRARLLGPMERLREAWLVARDRSSSTTGPDGLPLPPTRLRLLVSGSGTDADQFIWVGRELADSIGAAVADSGSPLEEMGAILDFGCGSGRVARHWAGLEGPEVHGCDYNPALVGWCAENLPFVHAAQNELAPPAPYEADSFDLVYAFSVLSHLDEDLQRAWVEEWSRILRPGGLLIVSVLGEADRHRLTEEQAQRFDGGELVIERPRMAGSNLCTAYHPRSFVTESLLSGFEDVRAYDQGTAGRTLSQDAYIGRLPA